MLITLILFFGSFVFPQPTNPNFTKVEAIQAGIHCLYQDRAGFLWAGSKDGLYRHDGIGFRAMELEPGQRLEITALMGGADGILWIGTKQNGILQRSEGGAITRFPLKINNNGYEQISLARIWDFHMDSDGSLWIATDSGLYKHRESGLVSLIHEKTRFIRALGSSIIAGCENGLYRFSAGNEPELLFASGVVNDFIIGPLGARWVSSKSGLYRADRDTWDLKPYEGLGAVSPLLAANDALWVGRTDGLHIIDPSGEKPGYKVVPKPGEPGFNRTSALFMDHSGSIWVGARSGLTHYDPLPNRFRQIRHDPKRPGSLGSSRVRSLYYDSRGILWIGTLGGGLNRLEPGSDSYITTKSSEQPGSLHSDSIYCLVEDRKGRLWVGSNRGLHRTDEPGGPFTLYIDSGGEGSLTNNQIRTLYVDRKGTLWIGTKGGGLFHYEESADRFHQVTSEDFPIAETYIYQILEDLRGYLWLSALDDGVLRYHPNGELTHFKYEPGNPRSLSNNVSFGMALDDNGQLWVGSEHGLNLFHAETQDFELFLPEDERLKLRGLVSDGNGNLWISCDKGIYRFHIESAGWRLFGVNQLYNAAAIHRSTRGDIYVGGDLGYTVFNPEDMFNVQKPPIPVIRGIMVGSKHFRGDSTTVPWHNKILAFEYSALHFTEPDQVTFAYRLEGVDEEWRLPQNGDKAMYGALNGGSYTFRLKARNSDGIWSVPGTSVDLEVSTAPWLTWWALLIYITTITFVIRFISYFRTRRLSLRNTALERIVAERTEALRKAHADLIDQAHASGRAEIAVSTLHNVGNTLNSISISTHHLQQLSESDVVGSFARGNQLLNHILDQDHANAKAQQLKEYFRLLERKMAREKEDMNQDVNRIREKVSLLEAFIRSQQGFEEPRMNVEVNLNHEVKEVLASMEEHFRKTDIRVRLEHCRPVRVMGQSRQLKKVFEVLFDNAVEAMEQSSHKNLAVLVDSDEDWGIVQVRDSGKGFEKNQKEALFVLGFSTKEKRNGFSLHMAANEMAVMNGSLQGDSEGHGKGAVFRVRLPISTGAETVLEETIPRDYRN